MKKLMITLSTLLCHPAATLPAAPLTVIQELRFDAAQGKANASGGARGKRPGWSIFWVALTIFLAWAPPRAVSAPVVTVHQLPGATTPVNEVAWGGGRFVAIGDKMMIYSSSDGVTWTRGAITAASGFSIDPNANLTGVAFGNGWWVAVGANVADEVLLRSSDGQNWTASNPEYTEPYKVTFTNGQFVVGDNDRGLYLSSDGGTWTRRSLGFTSSTGRPQTAIFGNGFWAIPNTGSSMFRSPDLALLQGPVFSTVSASPFTAVMFDNGIFIALDTYGQVRVSTDALTYEVADVPMPNGHRGYGCAWGSSGYVICTNRSGFPNEGWLLASDDGYQWARLVNVGLPMYGIAQGQGLYVAGASGGRVVRLLQDQPTVRQLRDGRMLCYWPAQPDTAYDLQQSTNLAAWSNVGIVQSAGPGIEATIAPSGLRRYYRLKRR